MGEKIEGKGKWERRKRREGKEEDLGGLMRHETEGHDTGA